MSERMDMADDIDHFRRRGKWNVPSDFRKARQCRISTFGFFSLPSRTFLAQTSSGKRQRALLITHKSWAESQPGNLSMTVGRLSPGKRQMQLLQSWPLLWPRPKVARCSQPRAVGWNPVGILPSNLWVKIRALCRFGVPLRMQTRRSLWEINPTVADCRYRTLASRSSSCCNSCPSLLVMIQLAELSR